MEDEICPKVWFLQSQGCEWGIEVWNYLLDFHVQFHPHPNHFHSQNFRKFF